jgi:hypothetical protein
VLSPKRINNPSILQSLNETINIAQYLIIRRIKNKTDVLFFFNRLLKIRFCSQ